MPFAAARDNDSRGATTQGWFALGVAIVALTVVLAARPWLVRLAPQTAVLFETVGLPVNLVGVEIVRSAARIITDGDRRVLVVDGQVANSSLETRRVPAMRVSIRSAEGHPLYAWTTKTSSQTIAPGEQAAFSARLAAPPTDAVDVVVEFDNLGETSSKSKAEPKAGARRS
jgi:hypothetical protein